MKIPNREVVCTGNADLDTILLKKQDEFIASSLPVLSDFCNKTIDEFLLDKQTPIIVRDLWKISSNFLIERIGFNSLIGYFQKFYFVIMNDEEMAYLDELDEEITIFRGESKNRIIPYPAISWTLNEDVAKVYAATRDGSTYKGVIKKQNIYCLFFDEMEILVKPGAVNSIEEVG